ncbi:hypothetical protein [Sphaerotilus mobilis]|uniref:Methyltransferase family protein n=1 Tax=Sphaerotilus mobilis TaxID=47994 RepID=A0A4Q7LQ16_9BURK|nr:hypothetical protein [Sphaerotilus mobilis]RZS56886.1 hypothetical protein EV685_1441 [Sphaerotilus mobilis]
MPAIHLCVVQPAGRPAEQLQALAGLDLALMLRTALRQSGRGPVTLAKNRLRDDAVNLVIGGHRAVDPAAWADAACVLVNAEPLGQGAAALSPHYLRLLQELPVLELDAANLALHGPAAAGRVALLHPSVDAARSRRTVAEAARPLADRAIELLHIGRLTPWRVQRLQALQALGVRVARMDAAVHGPERDELVRNARAVLLLPETPDGRPEAVTAMGVMALGTPVIAELADTTRIDPLWRETLLCVSPERCGEVFGPGQWNQAALFARLQAGQDAHAQPDLQAEWTAFDALVEPLAAQQAARPARPAPDRLNADMAHQGHRPGWLNLAADAALRPDVCASLGDDPAHAPALAELLAQGAGRLAQVDLGDLGDLGAIGNLGNLGNLGERAPDTSAAATRIFDHALSLLRPGGVLVLRAKGLSPAQARERLAAQTDAFWRSGWFRHRLSVDAVLALDAQGLPSRDATPHAVRIVLRKVETSLAERTLARVAREDYALDDA